MMRDLRAQAEDLDVSHLLKVREVLAETTVEDAEATQDPALRVPIVKEITIEETMEMFSVEIAVVKEVVRETDKEAVRETDKEAAREVAREEVKDITTMIDLITSQRVEDLRQLVAAPETTITTMTIIGLAKDTTIKIMTIPAKTESEEATSATKTTLAAEDPLNKIIMANKLVMITEDHLSKTEETTTIKTIV